jgi:hypothetical protein
VDPTLAALRSKHDSPADVQALRRDYTRPRLGCCRVAQHRRRPCRCLQINRKPLCTPSRPNLDPLIPLTPFPIQTSLSYLITFSVYVSERGQRGQRGQSVVTHPPPPPHRALLRTARPLFPPHRPGRSRHAELRYQRSSKKRHCGRNKR